VFPEGPDLIEMGGVTIRTDQTRLFWLNKGSAATIFGCAYPFLPLCAIFGYPEEYLLYTVVFCILCVSFAVLKTRFACVKLLGPTVAP
jgi:hypothetical protein